MAVLYLVGQPEILDSCLEFAEDDDVVLLIGRGTGADLSALQRPIHLLGEELAPAAVESERISVIGYPDFVDLVARCHPIVNWR